MAAAGVPDEITDLLGYLFGEVLDGRNAYLTDGVQRALGREPRDFCAFARDAARERRLGRVMERAMTSSAHTATLVAALGCGLAAGVFFAFSTFVMDGLNRLPAPAGIAAMQSINRTAVSALFMTALFGTAVLCLGLAVWAAGSWGERRAPWVMAGSVLYLLGPIGVTIARNVPLNDRLEALRPNGAGAAQAWTDFVTTWTAWNHVRTVGALAAAALLIVALTSD